MKKIKTRKRASLLDSPEKALKRIERLVFEDENGCHIWSGSTNYFGYGQLGAEGRTWSVHRLRFELLFGDLPRPDAISGRRGYMVLHHCDVPSCCNPAHLYVGTAADNARDMANRRRMSSGYRPNSYTALRNQTNRPVGTVFWEFKGEIRELREWASMFGLHPCTLDGRFRSGWSEKNISRRPERGFRNGRLGTTVYRRFSGVFEVEAYLNAKENAPEGRSSEASISKTEVSIKESDND